MHGYNIHFFGDHGICRDYFDAPTLFDAMCQFFTLRGPTRVYRVREIA